MKLSLALSLLSAAFVNACGDGHDHAHDHHKREVPSAPLSLPSRPLVWGDLNIIHTTDTHGWLLGHQKTSFPEPNYSGDLGDFNSFVTHMKRLASQKGVDLLLIDSGDVHDGTGLSDGYPSGGVDGHDSNEFLMDLSYDVMAIGNHELYNYSYTYDMYRNFAPALKGRYLSSNVNITVLDEHGNAVSRPVGERFAKFTTHQGRKITSLGVLFDFTDNDVNTTVQTVANMVQEPWFSEAIAEEPDLFLLVGHMPVSQDNWPTVFSAVRAVHPHTPILILGGHTHIRDCRQFDGRSMALESGRYMETVGWMSINLTEEEGKEEGGNLTFSRRYLDQNRVTYEYHALTSNTSFDTAQGVQLTYGLQQLAKKYNLDYQYGVAPHDFTIYQDPYPSENSSLSLFIQKAAPVALSINNTRSSIPSLILTNSGSQRFDVYSGPFTKNDQITASPFTDAFVYVANVTYGAAKKVVPALNQQGAQERIRKREVRGREVDGVWRRWVRDMAVGGVGRREEGDLTLGYVTTDSCPGIGDDTPHTPLPYYDVPDFIQSSPSSNLTDSDTVDLVFVDFIQDQLLEILNGVQGERNYTSGDVESYSEVLSNAVLGLYAEQAWN